MARAEESRIFWSLVILFGALPLIVTLSNAPWFGFHNWDPKFTFQLGNEATMDRPWLGTISLVAIYNRALTPEEVAGLYAIGFSPNAVRARSSKNDIALYTFDEGGGVEVRDVSGYGTPLNLVLQPRSHFRWLRSGIEILEPGILKSDGPATKLVNELTTSNELSIEVWMMPADVRQKGPARIVSLSANPLARNFTVAQESADIEFRLRTPVSGTNGTTVNLRTGDSFMAMRRYHLVTTYKEGVETLYVDGREHPDNADLRKANIIVAFGPNKNPIAQVGYALFYALPVSCFLSLFFSRNSTSFATIWALPVMVASGLLSVAEMIQTELFSRSIDLPLVGYGIIAATVGAFSGVSFAKKPPALRR